MTPKRGWGLCLMIAMSLGNTAQATPDGQKVDAYLRKLFAAEIKCSPATTDANRGWCPVTRTATEKLTLPAGKTAYLGFSMSALDGDSVLRQMSKNSELAVLCIGPEPGDAKLAHLTESSEERTKQLAPVKAAVTKFLQGSTGPIEVDAKFLDEIQTQVCATYRKVAGEEIDVDNTIDQKYSDTAAGLYKVGGTYVVIDETSSTRTQVAVIAVSPLIRKGP